MTVERTYTVPLRSEFGKVPKYRRAKKAMMALKEFMRKHMKTDNVLIGGRLNEELWKNGIKNPPHHVKVTAVKDDSGECKVELFGHKYVTKSVQTEKTKKSSGLMGKMKDKLESTKGAKQEVKTEKKEEKSGKPEEKKAPEPVKAEPKAESKPEEKKEEKKEQAKEEAKPSQ